MVTLATGYIPAEPEKPLRFRITVVVREIMTAEGFVRHLVSKTDPPDALNALKEGATYEVVVTRVP